jgi:hypothetical protein
MTDQPTFEQLFQESFAHALRECLKRGMKPPLLVTTVARSQGVVVMSFADGAPGELAPTLVAEHSQGESFDPPYNVCIVDSAGVAALADMDPAR